MVAAHQTILGDDMFESAGIQSIALLAIPVIAWFALVVAIDGWKVAAVLFAGAASALCLVSICVDLLTGD